MGVDFLAEPIRRAVEKAQTRNLAATFLVKDALELDTLLQTFDSAIDCGLFHVFSESDRAKYVAGLKAVVKREGRLFLMCFSDEEPGTAGPHRISQADLRTAFAEGWNIESIEPARFQILPDFQNMFTPGGPKAWFLVAERD